MVVRSRYRRGAAVVGLIVVATAASAALAPPDIRSKLTWAVDPDGSADAPATPLAPADVAQPVRITVVRFETPTLSARYTGTIRPRHESPLGFRVGGKLAERLVDVGTRVTKGDVLAVLDPTDLDLNLQSALSEGAAARTDLDRAVAAVERTRTLQKGGHVSQASLDVAESDVAQARSRLDAAESAIDLARNQRAYATLAADGPGIVTSVSAESGQVVETGQAIVTIARTDTAEAEIALPEQRRADLAAATAHATIWGEDGVTYPLTVREVSPDVDPASRTYTVRLAFEEGTAVDLGRTVIVSLDTGESAAVATLPLASVHDDGTGPAVWRLTDSGSRVERVPVEVVRIGAGSVQVRGALAEGDQVVSLGAQRIDPDRPVKIVETAPDSEL